MKVSDFIKLYSTLPEIQALCSEISGAKHSSFSFSGLKGSTDAVVAAAVYSQTKRTSLFILNDRESAQYFANDLQHLMTGKEVLFYPSSYKKPYEFEETDNANVLLRAEVLNRLNMKDADGELVVTYPEALTEKVISKKTLIENTMSAKVGEKLDLNFITELLIQYEFEKADFVYEPGQFAIRGGIIDIFSFGNELPYRLELFGDEIESIRTFDPNTQLSVENKKAISIIPNVQNKHILRSTESFLSFFPDESLVFIKNPEVIEEVVGSYYQKAVEIYGKKEKVVPENLIDKPEERFESIENLNKALEKFRCLYFNGRVDAPVGKALPRTSETTPVIQISYKLNFNEIERKIISIYERAKADKTTNDWVDLFETSDKVKKFINDNIENVTEPILHSIDSSGINHIIKRHGDEEDDSQLPITLDDLLLIPVILQDFDEIHYKGKNTRGLEVIQYVKNFSSGIVYYFEEIRIKRKKLFANTMYKKRGRANMSLEETHRPNVLTPTASSSVSQISKNISENPKNYPFSVSAQPNFNKDFNILAKDLAENQGKGYVNYILTESHQQFEKLQSILEEIDPFVKVNHLSFSLCEGFVEHSLKIVCYTDHQIFDRYYRYKSKEKHSKSKAITLKELRTLQPGDYVTHADYGISKFVGLEKIEINGVEQEAIRLLFKDNDLMKVSILQLHKIAKYAGKDGEVPSMSKLGSPEWENRKKAVKKKVKEIAIDLIGLYAKRKAAPGFAYTKDNYLQAELETSFIYEDTPDQAKATEAVKQDMEKPHPMDRLVCGDVGFGKTEVAIRAAFKAACDGKQVAVMVPTTILAMQHYKTFRDRLEKFPVRVEYVSRFRTTAQIKETLKRVEEGKTDILIGTHRIVSKDVKFKNLGLMVIDEEQKFGVATKEKLKEMKVNVDTLTLTATPIPRTLQFSLMGARDLSIIATAPPNRQPVTTEVHTFNEAIVRDAISFEIKRGGQAFIVHNRVSDLYGIADMVKRLVPDCKVAVAHGQMEGEDLEKAMLKFIDGEFDVLVSTNIIESGLDIPNANTILINNAHHFGISDLHQMRGRVGRSNKKAYCYLLAPPISTLTGDAKKKLSALEEFSELGDGFKVAMRDLDIRGAGNLLGGEQSGFINDIGFELYHKLLDEAIQELKETEFRALFESELAVRKDVLPDCSIETDLAILIPDTYVTNISERLGLYNELDNLKDEAALELFITQLVDRFGPMPSEVVDLTETVKLRWQAEKLGFEKLSIKNGSMKCQFATSADKDYFNGPVFGQILAFVQKNPKICNLKETKEKLLLNIDGVKSIATAIEMLNKIANLSQSISSFQ